MLLAIYILASWYPSLAVLTLYIILNIFYLIYIWRDFSIKTIRSSREFLRQAQQFSYQNHQAIQGITT